MVAVQTYEMRLTLVLVKLGAIVNSFDATCFCNEKQNGGETKIVFSLRALYITNKWIKLSTLYCLRRQTTIIPINYV